MSGKIIIINGTSSAGKSTLCKSLRESLDEPFWYMASDQFIEAGMSPPTSSEDSKFEWSELRPKFFDGFHKILPSFASAHNNLIIEHIIESQKWMNDLVYLLKDFDVFFVGLHCTLEIIEEREHTRGNRNIGEGAFHMKTHNYCIYDLEIDCQNTIDANVQTIITAWQKRKIPNAFTHMYKEKFAK